MERKKVAARTGTETVPLRPSWLRGRMAKWAVLPYRLGLGALFARRVMILTTRGRVTNRERRAPLWYVREGDIIYCFSGWGSSSDWLKNLRADPDALIQVGKVRWKTKAVFIHHPQEHERILHLVWEKYGRITTNLFYHLDRLRLVAFSLDDHFPPGPEAKKNQIPPNKEG